MVNRITSLSIQWHITTACPNRCRHCYMYDPATYAKERENELTDPELARILESIQAFEKKWDAKIDSYAITGGDPLQRPGWHELVRELRGQGKQVVMMGIPESLTPKNLQRLTDLGVYRFQLSLDGLAPTHDRIRGRGSFERTVEGLAKLRDQGLNPQVMFTLHSLNQKELLPLLRFTAEQTKAKSFSFDLLSEVGNGTELAMDISPGRLLALFEAYLDEKERLGQEGVDLNIREKPRLFNLIHAHRGELHAPSAAHTPDAGGCLIGFTCFYILADGSVPACRRFPLTVGKMPEQSFEEIFLESDVLKKFRRPSYFKGCGTCDYYTLCRGCPAVVFGRTGDPFAPPPFCFKDRLDPAAGHSSRKTLQFPGLATTPKEEYELVAAGLPHIIKNTMGDILRDPGVLRAISLLEKPSNLSRYAVDPQGFLARHQIRLDRVNRFFAETYHRQVDPELKDRIRPFLTPCLFR